MEEKVYKILIVDDEKSVLNALRLTFKHTPNFKNKIVLSSNSKDALNLLANQAFDIIITDYRMPGLNGVELLCKVKERYPNIARILLTGYSKANISCEHIGKGNENFSDFIFVEKPWNNVEFREIIVKALVSKKEKVESQPLAKRVDNTETAFRKMDEMEQITDDVRLELKDTRGQKATSREDQAGTAEEALKLIDRIQDRALSNINNKTGPLQNSHMFVFSSIKEFNRFSVGIKELNNVVINEMLVMGDKYVIKISYYPKSIQRIA